MGSAADEKSQDRPSGRRLRVLQVTTIELMHEFFLLPFGRWFRDRGWQVDAAARGITSSDECMEAYDHVFESTWTRSPFSLSNFTTAPRAIRRIVGLGRYDIVHVHTPIAAFVTRWALRKKRRQEGLVIIYTVHGLHFHEHGGRMTNVLFSAAERLAGRWTDRMVVLTESDFSTALEQRLIDEGRLRLIPGIGIDTRYFDPDTVAVADVEALRAELGIDSEDPVLLVVARMARGKGHRDVLRAVAQQDPRVQVVFAGDGPLVPELRSLAAELGLAGRAHFLGHRKDVPLLLKASTATVIASEREGLSRCALESMSMGVPVVGSNIRGVRELLGDHQCGTLFQPGDVAALAAALAELLASPDLVARKGERGRVLVADYALEKVLEAYERLYLETIDDQ